MPRTNTNVVAVRAELMEEMDTRGNVQRETFIEHKMEVHDHQGLWLCGNELCLQTATTTLLDSLESDFREMRLLRVHKSGFHLMT
ncbi:hypothetical protein Tco_0576337 [Tanacetum coccineum]